MVATLLGVATASEGPSAEFPPSVFASRVVVTTSSRTEFPTVCTFRTVLVLSRGFSVFLLARGARAEVWTCHSCRGRACGVRCEEETTIPTRRPQRVRLLSSGRVRAGRRRRGGSRSPRS
ncbi:hypothetical protein Taro_009919 [Colocasia esculenta]|uniref:Uncharacterized protein n=1 Tax=Colocasia esculenta TaxID=4460 RepID=A0A843U7Y8_COLES|nr:hypothetical protein [Colocasia esculenta]